VGTDNVGIWKTNLFPSFSPVVVSAIYATTEYCHSTRVLFFWMA